MSTPTPFADPTVPNAADFAVFVYNQGVTTAQLPSNSLYLQWAFTYALDQVFTVAQMPAILYVLAVYNCGMHRLLQIAQDATGLALTSLAWAGGVVTATTTAALVAPVGTVFGASVSGAVPLGYNGAFQATVTGTNTFIYPLAANPGAETQAGTFGQTYIADSRKTYGLLAFTAGPVISSSDEGTSQTLVEPEWMKTLTISAGNLLKTPWGADYLSYTQQYGPNIVGFS